MTLTDVSQGGSLFRLSWTLDVPEAIAVARVLPTAEDLAVVPLAVTSFVDTIDGVEADVALQWLLVGETSGDEYVIDATSVDTDAPPMNDPRRFQAALILSSRLWLRSASPMGVMGGDDFGPVPLRFKDPDVEMLLVGLRRSATDLSQQEWPDVDDLRTYGKFATAITDAQLQGPLDSAVAIVSRRCKSGRSFA